MLKFYIFILMTAIILIGCGELPKVSGKYKLIGQENIKDLEVIIDEKNPVIIDFRDDGIIEGPDFLEIGKRIQMKYVFNNNNTEWGELVYIDGDNRTSVSYKFRGNELLIRDEDGMVMVYKAYK